MNELKKLAGDSATSAELWLLPIPLVLIAEGGLTDVQSVAVALCYMAFVVGRVMVKREGLKAVATKVAPLLLAGVMLAGLSGCASMMDWFDQPVSGGGSITIVNEQGQATTIDTESQIDTAQTLEIEGIGTVTIDPGPSVAPATQGDQAANVAGNVVALVTGASGLGMVVTKLLGGLIGSRREKKAISVVTVD
jgi:hypothetical protein